MSFAFLPFYTGDYRRDTQHLSMMEHGAYCLMLMHCWDQRGPLPIDERRIFGICNARSSEEMGAVRHVLAEFFTRMDDGWYNKRMDREIGRANALSTKLSTAGKRGAKVKSLNRQGILSEAEPRLSQGQAKAQPLLHTPTPTTTPTTTPTEFQLSPSVEPLASASAETRCPVDQIIEMWNSIVAVAGGQKALNLSKARRDMITRRWREVAPVSVPEGLAWFQSLFRDRIAASKFCTGRQSGKDGRIYRIGIDTAMRSELQLDQIAEGKYA